MARVDPTHLGGMRSAASGGADEDHVNAVGGAADHSQSPAKRRRLHAKTSEDGGDDSIRNLFRSFVTASETKTKNFAVDHVQDDLSLFY